MGHNLGHLHQILNLEISSMFPEWRYLQTSNIFTHCLHRVSVADPGGPGGPPPIFGKLSFIFTLYTMFGKIFLKLNLDFIVAEIRGVFGSVGVYACVCESKSWPLLFFCSAKAPF